MNFFLKIFLITIAIFAIGFGFAEAASDDLFSGFAWSENIGWVSFNCTSDDSCDDIAYSYGVTFDEVSGKITGWAWSENIGWITFNRSEAGDPPEAPYSTTSDGIAYIDLDTDELSGWGRALSYGGGWDGWISLSGTSPDYGVTRNNSNQELEGYAWGGDVVGWLSFNCSNDSSCASSDYAVETYGGDTNAPYSYIASPDSESWYSEETFDVQITDEETGSVQSGLDTDNCKYMIINMDGLVEDSSTGYLDRECNSTKSITVEEGGAADTCHVEGEDSCYIYVASKDMAGNWSTSTAPSYNYYNIDWTPPEVTKIYLNEIGEEEPISVTEGVEYNLKSAVSDNLGVDACQLVINRIGQPDTVTIDSGIASVDYQFTEPGNLYTNYMRCRDNAWNLNEGSTTTFFTVEPAEDPVITSLEAYPADCSSSDECTDQFSCCIDYTTQSNCCTQFSLDAYDPLNRESSNLSYDWDFKDGASSSSEDPSHHFSSSGSYVVEVTVTSNDTGKYTTETLQIDVADPTLSVNMSAIPSFGLGTLSDVDLRDIVSGTMFGTINYKFDCTNDSVWEIDTTESSADYTATDTCDYNATGTYTAITEVGRGTSSDTDTVSISVAGSCTPGETMSCTSNQGCSHTITCAGDGAWPSCPTDTCTVGDTQGCGTGFTQTCTASCEWGTCTEIGNCTENSDCRCPVDSCSSGDYYDYPQYGTCVNYYCNIDTETGDPCAPTITVDDDTNCNFAPICNSLIPSPSTGVGPLSVTLSVDAIDDNGDIQNYSFEFGDGTTGESSLSYISHTYAGPGEGEAEGSSVNYTATVRAQDEVGNWSSTTTDAQATITVTKNHTPSASIGCDASGCSPEGSCSPSGESIVYKGGNCSFNFTNTSTDEDSSNLDGNNHISISTWSIYDEDSADWWANPYITFSGDTTTTMGALNLPLGVAGLPTSRNYHVLLEVEDAKGATATATADFYVRDDVNAAFECALVDPDATTTSWRSCDGLSVSEGERVYFRDLSEPSETAATTTSHAWTFAGGTPSQATYASRQNTSATFVQGDPNAGRVTLEVTDSLGRVNSVQKDLTVTIPLPEWQEIAPID